MSILKTIHSTRRSIKRSTLGAAVILSFVGCSAPLTTSQLPTGKTNSGGGSGNNMTVNPSRGAQISPSQYASTIDDLDVVVSQMMPDRVALSSGYVANVTLDDGTVFFGPLNVGPYAELVSKSGNAVNMANISVEVAIVRETDVDTSEAIARRVVRGGSLHITSTLMQLTKPLKDQESYKFAFTLSEGQRTKTIFAYPFKFSSRIPGYDENTSKPISCAERKSRGEYDPILSASYPFKKLTLSPTGKLQKSGRALSLSNPEDFNAEGFQILPTSMVPDGVSQFKVEDLVGSDVFKIRMKALLAQFNFATWETARFAKSHFQQSEGLNCSIYQPVPSMVILDAEKDNIFCKSTPTSNPRPLYSGSTREGDGVTTPPFPYYADGDYNEQNHCPWNITLRCAAPKEPFEMDVGLWAQAMVTESQFAAELRTRSEMARMMGLPVPSWDLVSCMMAEGLAPLGVELQK